MKIECENDTQNGSRFNALMILIGEYCGCLMCNKLK